MLQLLGAESISSAQASLDPNGHPRKSQQGLPLPCPCVIKAHKEGSGINLVISTLAERCMSRVQHQASLPDTVAPWSLKGSKEALHAPWAVPALGSGREQSSRRPGQQHLCQVPGAEPGLRQHLESGQQPRLSPTAAASLIPAQTGPGALRKNAALSLQRGPESRNPQLRSWQCPRVTWAQTLCSL